MTPLSIETYSLFEYGNLNKAEAVRRIAEWNNRMKILTTALETLEQSPDTGRLADLNAIEYVRNGMQTISVSIGLLTKLLLKALQEETCK